MPGLNFGINNYSLRFYDPKKDFTSTPIAILPLAHPDHSDPDYLNRIKAHKVQPSSQNYPLPWSKQVINQLADYKKHGVSSLVVVMQEVDSNQHRKEIFTYLRRHLSLTPMIIDWRTSLCIEVLAKFKIQAKKNNSIAIVCVYSEFYILFGLQSSSTQWQVVHYATYLNDFSSTGMEKLQKLFKTDKYVIRYCSEKFQKLKCDHIFEKKLVPAKVYHIKYRPSESAEFLKGAVIKARIIAGDSKVKSYDVLEVCYRHYRINCDSGKYIHRLNTFLKPLPMNITVKIQGKKSKRAGEEILSSIKKVQIEYNTHGKDFNWKPFISEKSINLQKLNCNIQIFNNNIMSIKIVPPEGYVPSKPVPAPLLSPVTKKKELVISTTRKPKKSRTPKTKVTPATTPKPEDPKEEFTEVSVCVKPLLKGLTFADFPRIKYSDLMPLAYKELERMKKRKATEGSKETPPAKKRHYMIPTPPPEPQQPTSRLRSRKPSQVSKVPPKSAASRTTRSADTKESESKVSPAKEKPKLTPKEKKSYLATMRLMEKMEKQKMLFN